MQHNYLKPQITQNNPMYLLTQPLLMKLKLIYIRHIISLTHLLIEKIISLTQNIIT